VRPGGPGRARDERPDVQVSNRASRALRIGVLAWRELANPQAGGSEVVVDRLIRGLSERGYDVTLFCAGPVCERPYRVVDLGGAYAQYFRAPLRFRRDLKPFDAVIDVENGIPFFAPLWSGVPVVCLVHHVHTDQWALRFPPSVARLGSFLEGRVMPAVYRRSSFVADSASTASQLRALGIDGERIMTLVPGIDLPNTLVPDASEPQFLALGRLVPHKRIDLLLKLWERVRPMTGGRLVIAGDGPEGPRLRSLAGSSVEFTGSVSEETKRTLLGSSWLLVHTAQHEGWGLVLVEAAAAGTPAVALDVPGVRDAVSPGRSGVLAASEDELIEAWIGLARDVPRRRALSKSAREHAETFSWGAYVDRFSARLETVATTAGGPG
jgi:glycosyltransferase involved in cell wall biosynthesis